MSISLRAESRQAAMVLHPIFIGWVALVVQLPLQLFFTVWAGGFFGALARSLFGLPGAASSIVFGLLAFFGIPCVAYIGKKLNYAKTEYWFYADHFEFEEGFFTKSSKIIAYGNIRETSLRKGLLQRTYGLGTIYLGTLATGSNAQSNPFQVLGLGSVSASGVYVRDVANPDSTF